MLINKIGKPTPNFFLRTLKIALTLHLRSLVDTTSFTVPPRAIVIGVWKVGKYWRGNPQPDRNQVLKVISRSIEILPDLHEYLLVPQQVLLEPSSTMIFVIKRSNTTLLQNLKKNIENLDIHSLWGWFLDKYLLCLHLNSFGLNLLWDCGVYCHWSTMIGHFKKQNKNIFRKWPHRCHVSANAGLAAISLAE